MHGTGGGRVGESKMDYGQAPESRIDRKQWVENIRLRGFFLENVDSMRNIPINRQKRHFCLHYLCNSACCDDILKHYRFITMIMLPFPML